MLLTSVSSVHEMGIKWPVPSGQTDLELLIECTTARRAVHKVICS